MTTGRAQSGGKYRIEALARGLQVLRQFNEQTVSLKLSELSKATGIPMPTVFGITIPKRFTLGSAFPSHDADTSWPTSSVMRGWIGNTGTWIMEKLERDLFLRAVSRFFCQCHDGIPFRGSNRLHRQTRPFPQ